MPVQRYRQAVCESVLAHADTYTSVSDAIWEHPEVNFHEDFSAAEIRRC